MQKSNLPLLYDLPRRERERDREKNESQIVYVSSYELNQKMCIKYAKIVKDCKLCSYVMASFCCWWISFYFRLHHLRSFKLFWECQVCFKPLKFFQWKFKIFCNSKLNAMPLLVKIFVVLIFERFTRNRIKCQGYSIRIVSENLNQLKSIKGLCWNN